MDWNAELLSRLQFAFTIAFHIIFPSFTIGLASYLAVLEGLWLFTKKPVFKNLYLFWIKIFALAFGMGVVSGVVMSYQFGTNWAVFSDKAGNVLGPLLAYEVLTAFFLEASFLGIMLFGWKRVGPGLHFTATICVAVGTSISAFWILAANSWMQTPAGYVIENGRFFAENWIKVIFNPSFPTRFAHMLTAAYLTTALVVLGAAAWHALIKKDNDETKVMRRMAVLLIAILAPIQIFIGDESGKIAHEHQPAKVAAMEGWWDTQVQPTILFGWPDEKNQKTHAQVAVPGMGSLIVAGDSKAELKGLKEFKDHPPVFIVFWAFRIMVGMGLAMLAVGWWGAGLWAFKKIDGAIWFQRAALLASPAGFIAVLAGWISAEVGRQPFVVYGLLRTSDAISPVEGAQVALSLLVFIVAYAIVFSTGALYILRIINDGPGDHEAPLRPQGAPGAALSAAPSATEG